MAFTFVNLSFEDAETGSPELDSKTQEVINADGWTLAVAAQGWIEPVLPSVPP